ncbi:MAG: HAD family hydrolase [Polyangiales bacterium]
MLGASFPDTIHTVTFDCWSTLIYEAPGQGGTTHRARRLAERIGRDEAEVATAFTNAWREHATSWHRRVVFAGPHMLQHALQALGITLSPAEVSTLLTELEDDVLARTVVPVAGAEVLLSQLRAAGVRTALICDTGFSPGRVVRQLLARAGLLEHLEVAIFSDEVGVPKPHPRAFASALDALGVSARGAVHVGDLRRSDIAGARAAGMATVRFTGHNDDSETGASTVANVIDCAAAGCSPVCERPEADLVVAEYPVLGALLAPRFSRLRS